MPDLNLPMNGRGSDPLLALAVHLLDRAVEWYGWLRHKVSR